MKQIIVNAEEIKVSADNVEAALTELDYTTPSIATALNGVFIPRELRAGTALSDGDRLEILAPMQGG